MEHTCHKSIESTKTTFDQHINNRSWDFPNKISSGQKTDLILSISMSLTSF